MKLTPGDQGSISPTWLYAAFWLTDPKGAKRQSNHGICAQKLLVNVGEIDPSSKFHHCSMNSFFASRFALILLAHSIEHKAYNLGITSS